MLLSISREQASINIEQSIGACQRLLILIEDERDALKDRNTEALERIIKEKSSNLLALEVGAKQRTQWLQAQPEIPSIEHAWAQRIEKLDPLLVDRWEQLKTLLEECRTHNEINGKMLARNQQVFKRLVAIVRGQGDHVTLYSPKGARQGSQGCQTLGEA